MQVLYVALTYLGYLAIWGIVCTLAFSLTLILKKKIIMEWFVGIATVIAHIINFVVGIWLLIYTFGLLSDGKIIWFIVMIMFGIGLVSQIFGFLQIPFILIPGYFSDKVDHANMKEEVIVGEILDEKGKVVGTTEEGNFSKNRKLALYFAIAYALNLISLYLNQSDYPNYKWGDYLLAPFLWIFSQVVFLGIFVGLYNKLKKRKFFYNGFKAFLTSTLKVSNYVLGALAVIFLLLGVW